MKVKQTSQQRSFAQGVTRPVAQDVTRPVATLYDPNSYLTTLKSQHHPPTLKGDVGELSPEFLEEWGEKLGAHSSAIESVFIAQQARGIRITPDSFADAANWALAEESVKSKLGFLKSDKAFAPDGKSMNTIPHPWKRGKMRFVTVQCKGIVLVMLRKVLLGTSLEEGLAYQPAKVHPWLKTAGIRPLEYSLEELLAKCRALINETLEVVEVWE